MRTFLGTLTVIGWDRQAPADFLLRSQAVLKCGSNASSDFLIITYYKHTVVITVKIYMPYMIWLTGCFRFLCFLLFALIYFCTLLCLGITWFLFVAMSPQRGERTIKKYLKYWIWFISHLFVIFWNKHIISISDVIRQPNADKTEMIITKLSVQWREDREFKGLMSEEKWGTILNKDDLIGKRRVTDLNKACLQTCKISELTLGRGNSAELHWSHDKWRSQKVQSKHR